MCNLSEPTLGKLRSSWGSYLLQFSVTAWKREYEGKKDLQTEEERVKKGSDACEWLNNWERDVSVIV